MQNLFKIALLCAAAAGWILSGRAEQEGVVTEGKINVRGQPSLIGEVVTQLQRGDKVTVLEEIKVENPKPGEPASWAKIKLPENTPVWIFSPFVKDGVVAASRLNLRAGPGENYSVVGRLERGAQVKVIRTIEEWMEIEAPTNAFAFVDSSLINLSGAETAAAAPVAAVAGTPAPAQPEETNNLAAPLAVAPAVESTPPPATETNAPPPLVAAVPAAQPLPQVAQPPPNQSPATPGRRIVRREGIVRPTRSIQAPTWYELVHPETKATINYLHEEKLGVNLKQYRGQRVIVSGEEAIDPRWPKMPIMELETLDIVP